MFRWAFDDDYLVVEVDQDLDSDSPNDRFRVILRKLGVPYFYVVLDYGAIGMDPKLARTRG